MFFKNKHNLFKINTLCAFLLSMSIGFHAQAQVLLTVEKTQKIPDHTELDYEALMIYIPVSGIPDKINGKFGLEKVILTVKHPYISDIKIDLISPDSTNVWISNRNGRNGQDYLNAEFSQTGFNGLISRAKPPFEGEYVPDGLLENFNNGQNPNGIWSLRIQDLKKEDMGTFEKVTLIFSENPAASHFTRCTPNTPLGCGCPNNKTKCELLPDITVLEESTAKNMWEHPFDPAKGYGMLQFEVSTVNIGSGPLEIVGRGAWYCGKDTVNDSSKPCKDGSFPRQIIKQNIYNLDKGVISMRQRDAGKIAFDNKPGHNHFHADDYAHYHLLEKIEGKKDPHDWKVIGEAEKASFCAWDMQFCSSRLNNCQDGKGGFLTERNMLNYGAGGYKTCDDPDRQGISVGGIDWYGLNYEGQMIRIPPNTYDGLYYLMIEIDPYHRFEESNIENNTILIPVTLKAQKERPKSKKGK
jgi:subtilisin-like proprotein convertase family protein